MVSKTDKSSGMEFSSNMPGYSLVPTDPHDRSTAIMTGETRGTNVQCHNLVVV